MKISELIAAVGDENVGIQNLDNCGISIDYSAKKGTKITFGTDQRLSPAFTGTERLGMVLWLDRDAVQAALDSEKRQPLPPTKPPPSPDDTNGD